MGAEEEESRGHPLFPREGGGGEKERDFCVAFAHGWKGGKERRLRGGGRKGESRREIAGGDEKRRKDPGAQMHLTASTEKNRAPF